MASWLRAAEELFEVVDRTAKQVVADAITVPGGAAEPVPARRQAPGRERIGTQTSHFRGSVSQVPARAVPAASEVTKDASQTQLPHVISRSGLQTDEQSSVASKGPKFGDQGARPAQSAQPGDRVEVVPSNGLSVTSVEKELLASPDLEERQTQIENEEAPTAESGEPSDLIEVVPADPTSHEDPTIQRVSTPPGDSDLSRASDNEVCDVAKHEVQVENTAGAVEGPVDGSSTPEGFGDGQEKSGSEKGPSSDRHLQSHGDLKQDAIPRVEDQLEEARGLLASGVSTSSSKEARLAKVCTGLSARLQEYKAENAQLEELLRTEREAKGLYDAAIKQLQQDLLSANSAAAGIEAEMAAALASKNAEIDSLRTSFDAVKRQASLAEGKLATLQANTDAVSKHRDMTESRMIQALREELILAERRAEEEHLAHNATRRAAVERETELEQHMAENTVALMRMQRTLEERGQRVADLEQQKSMLEVDCTTLNQELQEMEARYRREQKRPSEDAASNIQAWREEVDRARQAQREAESKLVAMEAETQKLRVDLASTKQDMERSSSQANAELEKRFRELTELLYLKQTQLEQMATEKAAAVLQLEKESRRVREAKAEVERSKSLRQAMSFGDDDDHALRSFDLFGLHQRRLGPSIQTAAKFIDIGAVSAGRFLWRRPFARLAVVFYVVFVHLFLLYLLHRLQVRADRSVSLGEYEAAFSAGITRHG